MNGERGLRICCVALLTLVPTEGFASIVWRSLPSLVHDCPTIVKGTIAIHDDAIILDVEKTFKGEEHQRLRVRYRSWFEVADPQLENGEAVLLFLYTPDPNVDKVLFFDPPILEEGAMYLFGLGDQAKWPRVYPKEPDKHKPPHHYPALQDIASLADIEDVVEKLLEIENTPNLPDKVRICTEYIRSESRLLQYTGMQYALQSLLWARPFGAPRETVSLETSRERFAIRRQLSREVLSLSLLDSNEPSLRAKAAQFLRYAPLSEAMPRLISRITDDDPHVRTAVRVTLRTFARELDVTDAFAQSISADDSLDQCRLVQQQWLNWWENNRVRLK
ncbi:MAG: HEAT repeat domain-containing protein [Sedimentisphaerales bacterium]|nr:HEAT repeat domain-containing protein [Sedimentisphaerales bacterium]